MFGQSTTMICGVQGHDCKCLEFCASLLFLTAACSAPYTRLSTEFSSCLLRGGISQAEFRHTALQQPLTCKNAKPVSVQALYHTRQHFLRPLASGEERRGKNLRSTFLSFIVIHFASQREKENNYFPKAWSTEDSVPHDMLVDISLTNLV